MSYAISILEKRRAELLDEKAWNDKRLAKGEFKQNIFALENGNRIIDRSLVEIDNAIGCIRIVETMYEKRIQGLNPESTSLSDYIKKWISNEG